MKKQIGIYKDRRPTRKKRWVIRWLGEFNPITGKQRWYSRQFSTRAEAESFLVEKRREFAQGLPRDKARKVTLGLFFEEWLNARRHELRPATINMNQGLRQQNRTGAAAFIGHTGKVAVRGP